MTFLQNFGHNIATNSEFTTKQHMRQTILTMKSYKMGYLKTNLCPLLLTFSGNLVGSGRFMIADQHAHASQKGQLAHLLDCARCAGN